MVATPQTFVATTIGRVAIPKLADTLVRTGADKFVKLYGQKAFEAVLGTTIGVKAYSKTEEYISEYLNHIDTGGDENSFVPKGSMPTATRAEQMDAMMAVPDTTHKSVTDTPSGLVIGGEKKEPLPPPEPFTTPADPQEPITLSTPEAEKQDTTLITPEPKKIDTTLSTPIPKESGPIIYTKDDASEQTKELVPEKPEFGKLTKTEIQTAKALKEGKPDFYSRAVESIKNAKQEKFTKGKWKSIVQSNSTKDEMDYLGLTEFLQGNESITKEELLKFVEKKDIAPNITVRSIPKDEMNKMYEGYSLGGYTAVDTQEHIVFQFGRDKVVKDIVTDVPYSKQGTEFTPLFKSGHFDTEYGTNTFAHARVQVGFDQLEGEMTRYQDLNNEEIEKAFKNTLIIDEIQSDWLQKGQDKGFISDYDIIKNENLEEYFKEKNIKYNIEYEPDLQANIISFPGSTNISTRSMPLESEELYPRYEIFKDGVHQQSVLPDAYEYSGKQILSNEEAVKKYLLESGDYGVPDFPVKESKKWVELVLNKMIEKAILDGRDSIAITNGQIQYNRYDAQQEEKKKGLKKFYDEIVFKQLEKISDKYNVELERIDITEGEAPGDKELQDAHLDNQIKRAQEDGYKLEKITLQELYDLVRDTDIPGHAALYSDTGVGQGGDYIKNYLLSLVDETNQTTDEPWQQWITGNLYGQRTPEWDKIVNKEVYIWKNPAEPPAFAEVWELPIVPVQDAHTTVVSTTEVQKHLETLSNQDLEIYSLYLKGIEPPQGEEIHPEQLIKMKLPKKLQKERLSKPIKLSKAKKQTDRLFA